MSRIRDVVWSADVASIGVLAKIIGEPQLGMFTRNRQWKHVRKYLLERAPSARLAANDVDYALILASAAGSIDVALKVDEDIATQERRIVEAFVKRVESSPDFDRVRFDRALREDGGVNGAALAGTFATGGLMALLSAGGFGTYIAMSTAMATATGIIGITLPFAAYTAASSLLSILLGPIGWVGLGFATFLAFTRGRNKKRDAMQLAAVCVWCAFATLVPPLPIYRKPVTVICLLVVLLAVYLFAAGQIDIQTFGVTLVFAIATLFLFWLWKPRYARSTLSSAIRISTTTPLGTQSINEPAPKERP